MSNESYVAAIEKLRQKQCKALERRNRETSRSVSEKVVAANLRKCVKSAGGAIFKMHPLTASGMPDYIVHIHGRTFYVETKTTGEECRPLQKERHRALKKVGIETYVLDTKLLDFYDIYIQAYKTYADENSRYYRKPKNNGTF